MSDESIVEPLRESSASAPRAPAKLLRRRGGAGRGGAGRGSGRGGAERGRAGRGRRRGREKEEEGLGWGGPLIGSRVMGLFG